MEVTPTNTNQATTGATASAGPSALTSDFQDFIELLTAQAKYQDPLQPINSTEYVAQLAQFSTVEQQVLTNRLMEKQNTLAATSTMASLSSWVGMQARAAAAVQFDGQAITAHAPAAAATADTARLIVRNADGVEVDQIPIGLAGGPVTWNGLDPDTGLPYPGGTYSFHMDSYADGEWISSEMAETYGRIAEAQSTGDSIVLIMNGGVEVPADRVTAVRD